ncbi:MAG: hypothetical protein ABSH34_17415 [Verrucomicrobiota bacterium]|jgi:hypothetical protein
MSAFLENMPATAPADGPFSHAEVSVYCDESRHEGQSSQKYMVIGGLWLLREKRYELLERLRALQQPSTSVAFGLTPLDMSSQTVQVWEKDTLVNPMPKQ